MKDDLPRKLANFSGRGYVIAPAGYGKTHLIALTLKESASRQLILTHTYAGVNAIKNKLQGLDVPASRYQLDTIASWALRLCLAFPQTSGWKKEYPTGRDWVDLYGACTSLLSKRFVTHLIECSYRGVFVDEYQDCSKAQHALVAALPDSLPVRLLGDPFQSIFDFADQPVSWEDDVYPNFEQLGELRIPWRWRIAGAHDLGQWLDDARKKLMAGESLQLSNSLPSEVRLRKVDLSDFSTPGRLNLFYEFLKGNDSVIAIHTGDPRSKNKTHRLAKALAGKFSSIEEIEGKELFAFIAKLEACATAKARLVCVIDFSKKCFSSVGDVLSAGATRGEYTKITKATRFPAISNASNSFLDESSSTNLAAFISALQKNPQTQACRRDLLNRLMNVLSMQMSDPHLSLVEAAKKYQREFRYSGRPIRHQRLVATTLLIKGLEYQHAIVLEAESFSPKELYVALTRGAKSVTIVTLAKEIPSSSLPPKSEVAESDSE